MSKSRERLEKLGQIIEKHSQTVYVSSPEALEVVHEYNRKNQIEECKKRYYGFFDKWLAVESDQANKGKFSKCLALEKVPGFSSLAAETQQSVQQHCKDQIFMEFTQCINPFRKK